MKEKREHSIFIGLQYCFVVCVCGGWWCWFVGDVLEKRWHTKAFLSVNKSQMAWNQHWMSSKWRWKRRPNLKWISRTLHNVRAVRATKWQIENYHQFSHLPVHKISTFLLFPLCMFINFNHRFITVIIVALHIELLKHTTAQRHREKDTLTPNDGKQKLK